MGVFDNIEAVDGLKTIDLSGFMGSSPQIRPKFKQLGKFLLSAQSFYLPRLPSGASRPLGLYLDSHVLIALIWSQCQYPLKSSMMRMYAADYGFLLDDPQGALSACYKLSLKLRNTPCF